MIFITRKEHFNAAHRLFRDDWDDKQNLEVFGKCSNPLWHGHNYTLYVTVRGQVSAETGFLANLKEVSQIIRKYVVDPLDHKNMNLEVDFMSGKIASTENLAMAIWDQLCDPLHELGCQLHKVRVEETENNSVEYFGPNK